jgi:hypothetical protein
MPETRLTTADTLQSIVHLLDQSARLDDNNRSAILVRVDRLPEGPDDEVQFSLKPLPPGMHPLEVLDGFIAPLDWAAVGVVARGKVRQLDDVGGPGTAPQQGTVVAIVARDGTRVGGIRVGDGPLLLDVAGPNDPVYGEIALALCRAVGVPAVAGKPEGATS